MEYIIIIFVIILVILLALLISLFSQKQLIKGGAKKLNLKKENQIFKAVKNRNNNLLPRTITNDGPGNYQNNLYILSKDLGILGDLGLTIADYKKTIFEQTKMYMKNKDINISGVVMVESPVLKMETKNISINSSLLQSEYDKFKLEKKLDETDGIKNNYLMFFIYLCDGAEKNIDDLIKIQEYKILMYQFYSNIFINLKYNDCIIIIDLSKIICYKNQKFFILLYNIVNLMLKSLYLKSDFTKISVEITEIISKELYTFQEYKNAIKKEIEKYGQIIKDEKNIYKTIENALMAYFFIELKIDNFNSMKNVYSNDKDIYASALINMLESNSTLKNNTFINEKKSYFSTTTYVEKVIYHDSFDEINYYIIYNPFNGLYTLINQNNTKAVIIKEHWKILKYIFSTILVEVRYNLLREKVYENIKSSEISEISEITKKITKKITEAISDLSCREYRELYLGEYNDKNINNPNWNVVYESKTDIVKFSDTYFDFYHNNIVVSGGQGQLQIAQIPVPFTQSVQFYPIGQTSSIPQTGSIPQINSNVSQIESYNVPQSYDIKSTTLEINKANNIDKEESNVATFVLVKNSNSSENSEAVQFIKNENNTTSSLVVNPDSFKYVLNTNFETIVYKMILESELAATETQAAELTETQAAAQAAALTETQVTELANRLNAAQNISSELVPTNEEAVRYLQLYKQQEQQAQQKAAQLEDQQVAVQQVAVQPVEQQVNTSQNISNELVNASRPIVTIVPPILSSIVPPIKMQVLKIKPKYEQENRQLKVYEQPQAARAVGQQLGQQAARAVELYVNAAQLEDQQVASQLEDQQVAVQPVEQQVKLFVNTSQNISNELVNASQPIVVPPIKKMKPEYKQPEASQPKETSIKNILLGVAAIAAGLIAAGAGLIILNKLSAPVMVNIINRYYENNEEDDQFVNPETLGEKGLDILNNSKKYKITEISLLKHGVPTIIDKKDIPNINNLPSNLTIKYDEEIGNGKTESKIYYI